MKYPDLVDLIEDDWNEPDEPADKDDADPAHAAQALHALLNGNEVPELFQPDSVISDNLLLQGGGIRLRCGSTGHSPYPF